jgi:hypothetical protein
MSMPGNYSSLGSLSYISQTGLSFARSFFMRHLSSILTIIWVQFRNHVYFRPSRRFNASEDPTIELQWGPDGSTLMGAQFLGDGSAWMYAYGELCLFRMNFMNTKSPKNNDFGAHDDPNFLRYPQSPSWKADDHIAAKDISRISWNIYSLLNVHNSPPMVHIPTQMNPVRRLPPYFCTMHFNTTRPPMTMYPKSSLPLRFPD